MRKLSGAATLAAATAALARAVPGGISMAQTSTPEPNLNTLVVEAKQLEFHVLRDDVGGNTAAPIDPL